MFFGGGGFVEGWVLCVYDFYVGIFGFYVGFEGVGDVFFVVIEIVFYFGGC